MRRIKNLTIVVLIVIISTGMVVAQDLSDIFESDNGRSNIYIEEASKASYKLVYPVHNTEIIYVKIYDRQNQLVFSGRIKNKNGFTRPYDFSKLPDGKYQFIIKGSQGSIVREIIHKYQHNDLNVSIVDAAKDHSYKLIVKGVSENPVYVDIYDNNTGLVLKDIIKVGRDFSRVYSFENIHGKYLNFIISQENNYVSKIVK